VRWKRVPVSMLPMEMALLQRQRLEMDSGKEVVAAGLFPVRAAGRLLVTQASPSRSGARGSQAHPGQLTALQAAGAELAELAASRALHGGSVVQMYSWVYALAKWSVLREARCLSLPPGWQHLVHTHIRKLLMDVALSWVSKGRWGEASSLTQS
jgi:hypothetical protein